jgi:hypothetical protein
MPPTGASVLAGDPTGDTLSWAEAGLVLCVDRPAPVRGGHRRAGSLACCRPFTSMRQLCLDTTKVRRKVQRVFWDTTGTHRFDLGNKKPA